MLEQIMQWAPGEPLSLLRPGAAKTLRVPALAVEAEPQRYLTSAVLGRYGEAAHDKAQAAEKVPV
jgi:hypothetical protein